MFVNDMVTLTDLDGRILRCALSQCFGHDIPAPPQSIARRSLFTTLPAGTRWCVVLAVYAVGVVCDDVLRVRSLTLVGGHIDFVIAIGFLSLRHKVVAVPMDILQEVLDVVRACASALRHEAYRLAH